MKALPLAGILLLLFVLAFIGSSATETPCALRSVRNGFVCVCNATYCDYLDPPNPVSPDDFVLISSSSGGLRFSTKNGKFSDDPIEVKDVVPHIKLLEELFDEFFGNTYTTVKVDRSKEFQNIVGFGGAFTGSVSYILDQLAKDMQEAIYQSYYSQHGIGYTLMRMPIGGTDFDLEPWAYNETPENDKKLTNFTKLDPRDELKVKQIKHLKTTAHLDELKILGSAWSGPRWMKTNNKWGGFTSLKKEYYQTWANYYLKFIELMNASNMPIWAITTGNEPTNQIFLGWNTDFMMTGWIPQDQAVWVTENLGPAIETSTLKNVKILAGDDQRYIFPKWFLDMNTTSPKSMDYIHGFAAHWYADDLLRPSKLEITHKIFPDKLLLNTESSTGTADAGSGPKIGSWERGEKYAYSIWQDLQNSFNGYIDWNIILDESGGPTYLQNNLDSPILVNIHTKTEFYKQPIFYSIGHFSKFIPEGSVKIEASPSNSDIEVIAFKRPDRKIAFICLNRGESGVEVTVVDSIRGKLKLIIPRRSIHTIVYN